jgi:glutamate-1-semialdehyde 2,1-aminomutase
LAALELLDKPAYTMIEGRTDAIVAVLKKALAEHEVEATVVQFGTLMGLFFGPDRVVDHDGAKRSAAVGHYPKFFHEMLDRSIALPPSAYEVFFPGLAHSWNDIERTGDAFFAAAATLKS